MNLKEKRELCLKRGLKGHCPRCESSDLFESRFHLHKACPSCGLPLESEDGWSLGAVPINYTLTCLFWVLPVALLFAAGLFSLNTALIIGGIGTLVIPIITYRRTKALWVGVYYAVLPHETEAPNNESLKD
jgi:uncharacterized protein (DUF983 family)